MGQEQINRQDSKQEEAAPVEAKDLQNEGLAADVEDILADIDEVLEAEAEEFVRGFVQKGGE